jgi:GNAT superfamily N-acetyltransferase
MVREKFEVVLDISLAMIHMSYYSIPHGYVHCFRRTVQTSMQTPLEHNVPLRSGAHNMVVRPLCEADLAEAKRIFHLAFGTFLGLPDPMQFIPDRDFVISRWRTDAAGALAVESEGCLLGSNIATRWGSVGFFGPLTIRPDAWDRGIARRLLASTMELFEQWQTRHVGLFTFPNSTKHVHLYQRFGFWPRFLTPIMSLLVHPNISGVPVETYSALTPSQREEFLKASLELTDTIYGGLDVRREVQAVAGQQLGDTVLLWDDSRLVAFAICHCGPDTEAGSGTCYVKFGAARTAESFEALLKTCEAFASGRKLARLEAGVNTARHDAYQQMIARGFRSDIMGLAMHKANDPGYSRPDVYVLDDWR